MDGDQNKSNKEEIDLNVKEMHYQDGALDLSLQGEAGKYFMANLVQFFKQNGGDNFLTMTVSDKNNKYAINIQNCNGTDTPAEKIDKLECMVHSYQDIAIDLARRLQRLEQEKVDLTVDDIKAVWKLKIAIGEAIPVSLEEGTGSLISKPNKLNAQGGH